MHNDRMNEIGRWAVPPEGTWARKIFDDQTAKYKESPEIEKKIKKIYEKAIACCNIQMENGAGLPADTLLREYNQEYNNRVFNYSLHQLPGSFNVVEAFNVFLPASATFKLRKEKDFIFSFGDFLDFLTSDEFIEDTESTIFAIKEGVIYSFNSIDNPESFTFSTKDGDEYGVQSIALIRHGEEVSVALLGGQICNLDEKTKSLSNDFVKTKMFNRIEPDENLTIEAVPLIEGYNLWRTIVLTRFDMKSSSVDARYVYQDAGQSYIGKTDDISSYIDHNGNFLNEELENLFKKSSREVDNYNSLFDVCKLAIKLPLFKEQFEDVIAVERHPTIFGQNRNKLKYKKHVKLADSEYKIAFRNVYKITPSNRKQPSHREITTPDLRVDASGYWKTLDFQSVGIDKNNQEIQGRTWVNKTLEWRESKPGKSSVSVKTLVPNKSGENHGYIYVMRSAAHNKNIFKIGLTKRNSELRSNELTSSTSSPDSFLVVEDWEVSDCVLAEKLIHGRLDQYRVNPKREFFKVRYKTIFRVIDEVIDSIDESS